MNHFTIVMDTKHSNQVEYSEIERGWEWELEYNMSILHCYVGHTKRSKEAMFKNRIIKLVQCNLPCGADMT